MAKNAGKTSKNGKKKHMKPEEIQELIDRKGWSQAQLGRELGVHESTVSLWVNGLRKPLGVCEKAIRNLLAQAKSEEVHA